MKNFLPIKQQEALWMAIISESDMIRKKKIRPKSAKQKSECESEKKIHIRIRGRSDLDRDQVRKVQLIIYYADMQAVHLGRTTKPKKKILQLGVPSYPSIFNSRISLIGHHPNFRHSLSSLHVPHFHSSAPSVSFNLHSAMYTQHSPLNFSAQSFSSSSCKDQISEAWNGIQRLQVQHYNLLKTQQIQILEFVSRVKTASQNSYQYAGKLRVLPFILYVNSELVVAFLLYVNLEDIAM